MNNLKKGYKKVDLNIGLDQKEPYDNLFQEQYLLELHNDFIENKEEKKHNMNSHSKWFRDTIKINHTKKELYPIGKWKICYVNFGMNIGTEINGVRPSIIYKHDDYKFGEDIVVIPITSYSNGDNKSKDTFDIILPKDDKNGLAKDSLIKVRQIRCISKKRLRKKKGTNLITIVGKVDDECIKIQIDKNVRVMFGL